MTAAVTDLRTDDSDLAEVPAGRWDELAVPEGWEPIAEICRDIKRDLAKSVRDTVDAIRLEVDLYRDAPIPTEDLVASVERNLEVLLLGIAERRSPTAEEIAVRSALGSRRARQAFPVDALLAAYHVGYRDLWKRFLQHTDDEQVSHLLLGAASTMWEWTHRITDAIGRAHAETRRTLDAEAATVRQRFLELLLTGEVDSDQQRTVCVLLGFEPRATFQAIVVGGTDTAATPPPRLQSELNLIAGRHQAIPHRGRVVVISQGGDTAAVRTAVCRLYPHAVVGVGLARSGLGGARLSVGDAERAARTADGPGWHTFEDTWLWAVLRHESDRLDAFLEAGRRTATDHPSLADTLRAYADGGFCLSAAARQLHVHPNTASYRLDRWRELTGWDPRTFGGLTRSLAAITVTG